MTGSIATFEFPEPLKPIDSSMVLGVNGEMKSCWDGCLIPIKKPIVYFLNINKDP